jgi:predicted FMN-binding regulatory protein PaiB
MRHDAGHGLSSGTPADLARLVADYPLAWLVNSGAHGFFATPLPLVAELDGRAPSPR